MQSLMFCGDLVLPFGVEVDYSCLLSLFEGKTSIVNLEGAILSTEEQIQTNRWSDKYSLYSQPKVIDICKSLNVKFASLCNNHILDYKTPIEETVDTLINNGIETFGLKNHDIIKTSLNNKPLYIITFSTCANEHALKLYKPNTIVDDIKKLKDNDSNCLIAVFPHWGMERLQYVEPADRQHAHRMIDAGADIIVGHHPHIIQQIEKYKGKDIIYSIGNFIFPQDYYGKKKLVFDNPEIQKELIVEWNGDCVKLHYLFYNASTNKLCFIEDCSPNEINPSTSNEDYTTFFKGKTSKVRFYIYRRKHDSDWSERMCFIRRKCRRTMRHLLINLKLHNPK